MNTAILKFILFAFGFSFFTNSEKTPSPNDPVQADPKSILENIRKFYASHDYIYHELSYGLYSDHGSSTPHSVDRGVFIKQGDMQYSRLASVESLTTKDYTIGVDHDEKLIMIANHISILPTGPLRNADRWISEGASITVRTVSDQLNAVSVKAEYGEVEEAEIVYDVRTFQPARLVLKYRRAIQLDVETDPPDIQPKLEIEYLSTGLDGSGKERLDMNYYVVMKGNRWAPSPKFREYELIDNIHENLIQN
jgi:hypothetical protein